VRLTAGTVQVAAVTVQLAAVTVRLAAVTVRLAAVTVRYASSGIRDSGRRRAGRATTNQRHPETSQRRRRHSVGTQRRHTNETRRRCMDPLTTAVASAVTRFLVDGASKLGTQVGAVAADAARTLAQMVLDRLGGDPAESKTVERYKAQPEAMQPAIEAALTDVVTQDKAFAAELQKVLADYDPSSAGVHVVIGGDFERGIIGDKGVVINDASGDITFNR
jgi:hypothetical protein